MKRLALAGTIVLTVALVLSLPSLAQEEGKKPPRRRPARQEERGSRHSPWEDVEFDGFREQVVQLGRQVRSNRRRIEELEAALAAAPEAEKSQIQSRLDEALKERAILRYNLARHRVRLTRHVLEKSRARHEEALGKLEKVKAENARDFPDLSLEDLPEISSTGE